MMMFQVLVVVATLFADVYAQNMTQQCSDAWSTLGTDPAASTCLSIQQVLPLASAIQSNTSVVSAINDWYTSLCAQPACSNKTISAVHKLLTDKCSQLDDWTIFDPNFYPTWRKSSCFKNANGTLCTTEYLTSVESYSGTVTFGKFQKVIGLPETAGLPANISCTNCNKAEFTIWANAFPSTYGSAKPAVQALCGAAFVDGQIPTGITDSSNTATSTATTTLKSHALGLSQNLIMGLTASAFIIGSSMYTILV